MNTADLLMDSQYALEKLPLVFRLGRTRILAPCAEVFIETENFIVKTVSDPLELKEIFKLRYDVFFREFAGRGERFSFLPYDVDLHDFACDHLAVVDKASDKIVATYRLLFQDEGEKKTFYTEGEFDLSGFHALSGRKLELGRACVHKDHRSGAVISLIWKGLCQYAKKSGARWLFGCSSLCRSEFASLPYIFEQLKKRNAEVSDFRIPAKQEYSLASHPKLSLPREVTEGNKSMPSLMNMYLLAGARMGTEIAYDEEMDCLDFFTVMDFTRLPPSFERRFA